LLEQMTVYRSYPGGAPVAAPAAGSRADRPVIAQLERWLAAKSRAATQFQQLSAPLAAKAVEDTAFYRYGRLLSRVDVGFDAARFALPPAAFHAAAAARSRGAMLATATHDHKRGEDVRARLAVLSEIADQWSQAVERWARQNARLKNSGA